MNRPVFVTGASGFVARHIIRRLVASGHTVRALVHRTPLEDQPSVEQIRGDLTDPSSYQRALEGCSAVVHTAISKECGAEVVAQLQSLSSKAGISRMVHLSTISIYGHPLTGTITEDTSPIHRTDSYTLQKRATEEIVRGTHGPERISILRLGCVYHPAEGWWGKTMTEMARRGSHILVNRGNGIAPLVRVEDVAEAVALAIERGRLGVSTWNITGPIATWSDYFLQMEKNLSRSVTVSMSDDEARRYGKKWAHPSITRRILRKLKGLRSAHPLDDYAIDGFASLAVYSFERARREIGFMPQEVFADSLARCVAVSDR